MRILLVNPPIPYRFGMFEHADEEGKKSISSRPLIGPPLALNELAGALNEEEIIILDQKTELDNDPDYDAAEGVIKELKAFNPEIVGFTCITSQFNSLKNVLSAVKKYNKEILTVVGGLHTTACPDDFSDYDADILVLGLGKTTFYRIVQEFKRNRKQASFLSIPGIAIKNHNQIYYTKSLKTLSHKVYMEEHYRHDLYPNRQLTDKYNYIFPKLNQKITYLSTSLGCTHKCNFCYLWEMTNGQYLSRDPESIITELKTLDAYPVIRFCDAHTFGNIRNAKKLFTRILEEKLTNHIFIADVRTDTVIKHPELFKLANEAGLKVVICGLEATSDEELKQYGKENSIENIKNALRILNETKIYVSGNYIVRPDYDENDFERIAFFINENPIFHAGFTILTPFPGTYQWELLKDQIVIHDLDYYNLANAVLKTKLPENKFYDKVSELYKISAKAKLKFYEKYENYLHL